jgi:anti-sigma B factor antagonist
MILQYETRTVEPDITVVALSGRMSLGTRLSDTEFYLQKLMDQGARKLVLDLEKLEHIDSAGIGVVALTAGRMKELGGQVHVAGGNAQVARIFEITHLGQVISLHPDVASASKF